jgi:hypothetical protein
MTKHKRYSGQNSDYSGETLGVGALLGNISTPIRLKTETEKIRAFRKAMDLSRQHREQACVISIDSAARAGRIDGCGTVRRAAHSDHQDREPVISMYLGEERRACGFSDPVLREVYGEAQ